MFFLQLRMMALLSIMFAIIYFIIALIGAYMGVTNIYYYVLTAFCVLAFQYLIGPKMVELTMRVRYVTRAEYPDLYRMIEELAGAARIPVPRVAVSDIQIPNAFAFGRGIRDGRVCVTVPLLKLLKDDELKAVLGHEISHLRNRDVLTITLLSVIPMVMYFIYIRFAYFGSRRDDRGNSAMLIGLSAFIFYLITNLLVLYGSRIREYFADRGSVSLGNKPSSLASALYKLVYGSARLDKNSLMQVEGLKGFFASDPSKALNEIRELKMLDIDKSGTIDPYELELLRSKKINLNFAEKMLELYGTHPNMLKRIKKLSEY